MYFVYKISQKLWLDKVFFQVYYTHKHLFTNETETQHYFTLTAPPLGQAFKKAFGKQKSTMDKHPSETHYYIYPQHFTLTFPSPKNVNPLTSACKFFYIGT